MVFSLTSGLLIEGGSLISELEDYRMFEWGRGILCHSAPLLYAAPNRLLMMLGDTQSLISEKNCVKNILLR